MADSIWPRLDKAALEECRRQFLSHQQTHGNVFTAVGRWNPKDRESLQAFEVGCNAAEQQLNNRWGLQWEVEGEEPIPLRQAVAVYFDGERDFVRTIWPSLQAQNQFQDLAHNALLAIPEQELFDGPITREAVGIGGYLLEGWLKQWFRVVFRRLSGLGAYVQRYGGAKVSLRFLLTGLAGASVRTIDAVLSREGYPTRRDNPADGGKREEKGRQAKKRRRRSDKRQRPLTVKQTEAVQIVGECGGNIASAAQRMGLDRKTVKQHYDAAMAKLGRRVIKHNTTPIQHDNRGQASITTDDDRRG